MVHALQFSFPVSGFQTPLKIRRRKFGDFGIVCSSTLSDSPEEGQEIGDAGNKRGQCPQHVILLEKYNNGTAKRFILDDDIQIQTFLEEEGSKTERVQGSSFSDTQLSWLPIIVKDFILPAGFPVFLFYAYMELKNQKFVAVGVGSFSATTAAASAAASAAAIRWVSKDGIGAVGRLFIGGQFGNLFDDDPKQWRMYADLIGSAGSIFDLSTQLYPAYFLQLASLGNLAKAVARGLKDPSFRVIQNHFAISGNLGEVAAKEEVWEVAAQLLGLALGIMVLTSPLVATSYPVLAFTWMSMRLLHLWLRYQSLSVLRFKSINLKRARILVKSHVLHSIVPGYVDCNRKEKILSWQRFLKPRIIFGVSLEELIGGERPVSKLFSTFYEFTYDLVAWVSMPCNLATLTVLVIPAPHGHWTLRTASLPNVRTLLKLYSQEKYILVVKQQGTDFEVFVSFKVGATSLSVLRSIWQSYWLQENWCGSDNILVQLEQSLLELEESFGDFTQQLKSSGWDLQKINLKVPKKQSIEEVGAI
ncbi:Protein root UVB sensitive 5 [Vitis vinifera]|uniref:Protein root UVB sensitive 5 n=1 Tax=Vitis vinifera TaxID=29760 RepID=A0A438EA65_VITVI|nr:Protein root UVB sensitive 5 [Vitis vinifera]